MRQTYYCQRREDRLWPSTLPAGSGMCCGTIDYEDGYSLYVGIPFCPSASVCTVRFLLILMKDLGQSGGAVSGSHVSGDRCGARRFLSGKRLNTVYVGGGTPTTLTAEQLDRLHVQAGWSSFSTMTYLTGTDGGGRTARQYHPRDRLQAMKRAPGHADFHQSPDDAAEDAGSHRPEAYGGGDEAGLLIWPGRLGFDNINMDLIVGLPGEDIAADVRQYHGRDPKACPGQCARVHSLALKRAATAESVQR